MKGIRKALFIGTVFCILLLSVIALSSCTILLSDCERGNHALSNKYVIDESCHSLQCDNCDYTESGESHTYGELTVTKEATLLVDGEGYYICSVCGYKKETTIPGCTHTYETVFGRMSTCQTEGVIAHLKCPTCGRIFNSDKEEITLKDVTLAKVNHTFYHSGYEVVEPTYDKDGYLKLKCDYFDECGTYLSESGTDIRLILPKLSAEENYTITEVEGEKLKYKLVNSYVDGEALEKVPQSYYNASRSALYKLTLEYSACIRGHKYSPESYEITDNRLYYICTREAEHRLEIKLPQLNKENYYTENISATCISVGGTEYQLNQSQWNEVLKSYEAKLIGESKDVTLSTFSKELTKNAALFVKTAEINPDEHPEKSVVLGNFVPPTYDVTTSEFTVGKIKCQCAECEKMFNVEIEYDDGTWETIGTNAFNRKHYRTYWIYGQKIKDAGRTEFKYRIDLNGGEPTSEENSVSGSVVGGYIIIGDHLFRKDECCISGVSIIVDGRPVSSSVLAERVKEDSIFVLAHGKTYDCWKVYIGKELTGDEIYYGDVIIDIKWRLK